MKAKQKKGIVVVLSAPSGCGKTTVESALLKTVRKLRPSISATTRKKRKGERDGKDYFFLTKADFRKKIKQKYFLEWARVFDEYYGTPKQPIEKAMRGGFNVLLTIDVQGGAQMRKNCKDAVLIFLLPPSLKELERRLTRRKTDSQKEIQKRLREAKGEFMHAHVYDYVVVNDTVMRAVQAIKKIITTEMKRVKRNKEVIRGLHSA